MFLRLVFASLAARSTRVLLALVAVTLGVATATALATLSLRASDELARTLRAAGPNFVIVPRAARLTTDLPGMPVTVGGATLDADATLLACKRSYWSNNLLEAAPEAMRTVDTGGLPFTVVGTWFHRGAAPVHGATAANGDGAEPWDTGLATLRSSWRIEGRWPNDAAAEVALGRDLARTLALGVGDTLRATDGGQKRTWGVTGIVDAGGLDDRRAFTAIENVTLDGRGGADRVWLSALVLPAPKRPPPDPARDPEGYERYRCAAYPANVIAELERELPGVEVLPIADAIGGEARVIGRLDGLMLALGLAALLAATLGLVATTNAGVVERARELALLRALGAGPRQLVALLLAEALAVALAGGLLGWGLGSAAAAAIHGGTFAGAAAPQPLLLPLALALAAVVAVLGTLGALRMAARLEPATVLRG